MTVSEEKFRELYHKGGEDDSWDYKRNLKIDTTEEFAKFVKHVLAFANHSGGHLLLGVAEVEEGNRKRFQIEGVEDQIDPAILKDKLKSKEIDLNVEIKYFDYQDGRETKRVGIIYIPGSTEILILKKDIVSQNRILVGRSTIYCRQGTKSELADRSSIEKMIKRIYMPNFVELTRDNNSVVRYKNAQVERVKKQFRFLTVVVLSLVALSTLLAAMELINFIDRLLNWQLSLELLFNSDYVFIFCAIAILLFVSFSWYNHVLLSIKLNEEESGKYIDFGFFHKGDGLISKSDFITRGPKLIEKQGDEYIVSNPTGECIYPALNGNKCSGKIHLVKAPVQEKWRVYVSICSKCGKQHSYTINRNGLAEKASLNWNSSLKNTV